MRILRALVLAAVGILSAFSQNPTWDTSGNGLLNGTYYFRNVVYLLANQSGDLGRAFALYGQITFSGTGTYSIAAVSLDSNNGRPQNFSTTGTYSISASGYGFLSHPLSNGDSVFGLVSNDMFVGSSSESGFNDLFIAAKLPSPQGTVAALKGPYTLAYMNFPTGSTFDNYDALWQMSPDGAGNLGTVKLQAYIAGNGTSVATQSIPNVKYIFSNGAANMQFPNSASALVAGNEYLYLTQDGNFVFGGSPNGFDFFVGVRTPPSTGGAALNGLYYHAGIDFDASTLGFGFATLGTYYGSFNANAGVITGHQRFLSAVSEKAIDYTYGDKYAIDPDSTYTDTNTSTYYMIGPGGVRIGIGIGPFLGISAAVPVAPFSGSGVYLNPTGVLNAASFAPFTAGIAPGELITLYGSGLSAETQIASDVPFPTKLAGVQVFINGTAAPIYYVSPTQASVIVPYGTTASIAQIQVNNNGTNSNAITMYTDTTAPGIFTNPVGGLGYAAALHADFSLVSPSSPALPGEYIQVFVTGLGAVDPAVPDGAAGPVTQLSNATNKFSVTVGGQSAVVQYAGLAPQLAGLYQINLQIPSGLPAGDVTLAIAGPDSNTVQALLPAAGGTAAITGAARTPKLPYSLRTPCLSKTLLNSKSCVQ